MPGGVTADWLAVGLLMLVAFRLRVSQLQQTLIGDEVSTYQDIVGHSFGSVLSTVHTGAENSPPLFFLLAWFGAKLGDATVWIRVPSLLAGTAAVPVVYAIGRETMGRVGGLIAAAIMALTPFAVYYGIEARPYATMSFFVAVSTWALLRAVRADGVRWWVLYTLSATAAAYCHYTSVFVLGVQAIWSLWACRGRFRTALMANVLVLVLYSPWLPHLRGKGLSVIGTLYPLGFHRVLTDLFRPFPGHPGAPLSAIPTVAGLLVIGAGALGGVVAIILRRRRTLPDEGWLPSRFALLVALSAATPIGLLLYSLTVTDLWLPRGLSASLPATALVLGGLLAALPRPLSVLATAALVITLVAGTLRSFDALYARGPFRTMASYLDRVAPRRDPVTIVSYVGAPALGVELRQPHVILNSISRMWTLTPPGGNAYVVLDDAFATQYKIVAFRRPGFQLVARKHYRGNFPTELLTYRRLAAAH